MPANSFTLPDGTTVRLRKTMRRTLHDMPDTGFSHTARTMEQLSDLGLVEQREDQAYWELTQRGRYVRKQFPGAEAFHVSLPSAAGGGGEEDEEGGARSERLSISPELDGIDRQRIVNGLASAEKAPVQLFPMLLSHAKSKAGKSFLHAGAVAVFVLIMISPVVAVILAVVVALVGLFILHRFGRSLQGGNQTSSRRSKQGPAPENRELKFYEGRFVSPESLDEEAREVLVRCQTAVDRILESSLHTQNLLLDAPRNRIVLEDVEWTVAARLRQHTRARESIRDLTADGLTEGEAADRARSVLTEDVDQVHQRVATLEDYARQVMRAELERRDHPVSKKLHQVADDIVVTGAAQPHEDEALDALLDAQRLALEVQSLSSADSI